MITAWVGMCYGKITLAATWRMTASREKVGAGRLVQGCHRSSVINVETGINESKRSDRPLEIELSIAFKSLCSSICCLLVR